MKILAIAILLVATSQVHATLFNAAEDFSTNNNPNGVWSYGTIGNTSAPFGPFQSYTTISNYSGIDYWNSALGMVLHNGTNNPITVGSPTWQPGGLSIRNTAINQASVVRFTAPSTGSYDISGSFYLSSTSGLSDVGIAENYDSQFSANNNAIGLFGVSGLTGTSLFSLSLLLTQNDTIDFAVGGPHYLDDLGDTGLNVAVSFTPSISPVPEPTTLALLSIGILFLLKSSRVGYASRTTSVLCMG